VIDDIRNGLPAAASVFTRVMSWPPGARTILDLDLGKALVELLDDVLLDLGEVAV